MPEHSLLGSDLLDVASRVAGWARPKEQLEVYLSRGTDTDIRAYEGQIESLSSATSTGVGVRVVVNGRQGFAFAGSLDESIITQTVAEARDNAEFSSPDEHAGLAEPDGIEPQSLELWDDELTRLSTEEKVKMAIDLERAVRDNRLIRQVPSADYGDSFTEIAIASSTGIRASTRRTTCALSVSAIAGEGGGSRTGSGFSVGRGPSAVDPEVAAKDAIERASRLVGASKAKSGKYVVVFDPRVTSTVLAIISSALSGESVFKGRSFFAGRIGETVAVPELSLLDDPTDPRALGAATNDAEGLACRRNILIENGVLRGFVYDATAARRAGVASTGSAVRGGYSSTPGAGCRAIFLQPGDLDGAQILETVGDGLYVQSVTGVHSGVNPVSGDFSVGAEGLMIRDGILDQPVTEVTIASTLQKMLLGVLHVGSDLEWLPGVATGATIAIDEMTLSGS